jgi:hypothetical protein
MIYSPLVKHAIELAFYAHMGQYDKGGLPYITHPLHVAEQMRTEDECVVALLHDVMEDTGLTETDLHQRGITDRQIEALKLLCHDESVPYLEYVQKIRIDPIARAVKIEDLKHNADLTRLNNVSQEDLLRAEKYKDALRILQSIEI